MNFFNHHYFPTFWLLNVHFSLHVAKAKKEERKRGEENKWITHHVFLQREYDPKIRD